MALLAASRRRIGLQALAVAGLAGVLYVTFGLIGLAIATGAALALLVAPPFYAFGIAQIGTVVLLPTGVDVLDLLAVQTALGALLAADLLARWPLDVGYLATIGLVAAAGLFSTLRFVDPIWAAAGLLLAGFAATAYGLHRYGLVRLRLVSEVVE